MIASQCRGEYELCFRSMGRWHHPGSSLSHSISHCVYVCVCRWRCFYAGKPTHELFDAFQGERFASTTAAIALATLVQSSGALHSRSATHQRSKREREKDRVRDQLPRVLGPEVRLCELDRNRTGKEDGGLKKYGGAHIHTHSHTIHTHASALIRWLFVRRPFPRVGRA